MGNRDWDFITNNSGILHSAWSTGSCYSLPGTAFSKTLMSEGTATIQDSRVGESSVECKAD